VIGPGQFGRSRWLDAALESPVVDFPALRDALQTGDLWFSTGQCCNLGHFLIRLGTRSRWAHVGMVLRRQDCLWLIDAPTSGLRVVPFEKALLEEIVEECGDQAAIVIARPLALADADHPHALPERIVGRIRNRILDRVERGFPAEYDWVEIVRIVLILALGGLARRWRHRPLLGALAGLMPARHLRRLSAADEGRISPGRPWRRWLGQRILLSNAGMERRGNRQDPFTCAELVAELLGQFRPCREKLSLEPGTDDFLSPVVIAERVPLVVLGRLQ